MFLDFFPECAVGSNCTFMELKCGYLCLGSNEELQFKLYFYGIEIRIMAVNQKAIGVQIVPLWN